MQSIPNILSIVRVLLVPVFLVLYFLEPASDHFWSAFIVWLAAVTDWADGFLARRYRWGSAFGAFIDPVADKLIVASVLVVLAVSYQSIWITIPAVIIIGREITVSALREWMAERGKRNTVAVSSLGKYKTTAQMLALIGLVWQPSDWLVFLHWAAYVFYFIATALTLWSMVEYLKAAWPEFAQTNQD